MKTLTLVGASVPESEIQFSRGLNVISGPSDTGKTYIAQCINFMLGASTPPKKIPEADGYDTVRLKVETMGGEVLVLERSLYGGAFHLKRNGVLSTLGEKHQAENEDTLSHFLLSLTGLTGKKVRKNARGETRTLSFRDIAHLIVVGEEEVIAERSPIFSGQRTSETAESSVFRLLLTGADDSSIVEQEEPKVAKGKQQGKQELLEELLDKNSQEISSLGFEDIVAERVASALEEAERAIVAVTALLSTERDSAFMMEEERKAAWQALRRVESRAAVVTELQRRFELLQTQYTSDLRRLEAISEAGVRLAQMTEERCPVCGAIAEHQDQEHRQAQAMPDEVAVSCSAEVEKIYSLVRDLSVTIASNAKEIIRLEKQGEEHSAHLQAARTKLQDELQPRIAELVFQLQNADERRSQLTRLADLHYRREELYEMLEDAEKPIRRANKFPSSSVGSDQAEEFSKAAEELLRIWNFPGLDRVTFSEEDQDLVISGRKRSSYGKGVRALTHAAFTLALLRYSRKEGRPHPGLVIIDSPLVVYREPESSDGDVVYDVKDAFYRGLASDFSSDQVVILENEDPPEDLEGANVVAFTGTDFGRFGFLSNSTGPV
jgi:hypothetical protein